MDPMSILGLLGGGANILGGISSFFGGHKKKNNPAYSATNELNKIPGQVKPYYDPYINAGKSSLQDLQARYKEELDNPGGLYSRLGEGYTQSPGYQATLRSALSGANNASAMGGGGGLGSYGHQQLAAGAAGDVANKDFEQYINHILGIYGGGQQGEEGLNQQGYNASSGYADSLGTIGGQKANWAGSGQDWKNRQNQQGWSNLASGFGQLGSAFGGK
jgi:hypothetical protein